MFDQQLSDRKYPAVAGAQLQEAFTTAFRALQLPLSGLPPPLYLLLRHYVRQSTQYLRQHVNSTDVDAALNSLLGILESRATFGGRIDSQSRLDHKLARSSDATRLVLGLLGKISSQLPPNEVPLFFYGMYVASLAYNARMTTISPRVFPKPGLMREAYATDLRSSAPLLHQYLSATRDDSLVTDDMRTPIAGILRVLASAPELPAAALTEIVRWTDIAFSKFAYRPASTYVEAELLHIYEPRSAEDPPPRMNARTKELLERADAKRDEYWRALSLDALDEAIDFAGAAASESPPASRDRVRATTDLGGLLFERFERVGDLADLDGTISWSWQSLEATPSTLPLVRSLLNNFGLALHRRYERTGWETDLELALDALGEAVAEPSAAWPGWASGGNASPRDSRLASRRILWQTNYANALRARFHARRDAGDLSRAIDQMRDVLTATPPSSEDLSIHRQNLANALLDRFDVEHQRGDLDEALPQLRTAVRGTAPVVDRGICLSSLALALVRLHGLDGGDAVLAEARASMREAIALARHARVAVALGTAVHWGKWAFEREAWAEAMEAFATALAIGQELFELGFNLVTKEAWLAPLQGVAAAQAFAQARAAQAEADPAAALKEAVTTLENGLGRLLAQSLDLTRSSLDRLGELGHGELVERYRLAAARVAAHTGAYSGDEARRVHGGSRLDLSEARAELADCINAIRTLPGYEGFLLPASFDDVQRVAAGRLIVYLVATSRGGLALIMGPAVAKPVTAVLLPELTDRWVLECVSEILLHTSKLKGPEANIDPLVETLERVTQELGTRFMPLLESVFDRSSAHMVLIPVGPLGLLPLHAARMGDRFLLDDRIVSYSPNAKALARPWTQTSVPLDGLIVGAPQVDLPFTEMEIAGIERQCGTAHTLPASDMKRRVMDAARGYGCLHFSGHAQADLAQPLLSSLLLADGSRLLLSDILAMELPKTDAVVMSACQSGVFGMRLPDEVVSLATGFLQAGVRSVVSTLWVVSDLVSAMLMVRFYHLWRKQQMAPPEALILAQRWCRQSTNEEKCTFFEAEGLGGLVADLKWRNPAERRYESPWYWAGFYYTGSLGSPASPASVEDKGSGQAQA
jgi:tetratricopeptide (TPR) repeat protein